MSAPRQHQTAPLVPSPRVASPRRSARVGERTGAVGRVSTCAAVAVFDRAVVELGWGGDVPGRAQR